MKNPGIVYCDNNSLIGENIMKLFLLDDNENITNMLGNFFS